MANSKLFPTLVGKIFMRSTENQGLFYEVECATNIDFKYSTSNNTKTISCGGGDSITFEKGTGEINFKVLKSKNPDLIAEIFGLTVNNIASGETPIIPEKNTFDGDDIELRYISNDGNGVTNLEVKSEDGATTYAVNDDYTSSVSNNRTYIKRVDGGAIPANATVLISGKYNSDTRKEVELPTSQRVTKEFELEIIGVSEDNKTTQVIFPKVVMSGDYLLEFKDIFRDGDITGASLTFNTVEGANPKIVDANI